MVVPVIEPANCIIPLLISLVTSRPHHFFCLVQPFSESSLWSEGIEWHSWRLLLIETVLITPVVILVHEQLDRLESGLLLVAVSSVPLRRFF